MSPSSQLCYRQVGSDGEAEKARIVNEFQGERISRRSAQSFKRYSHERQMNFGPMMSWVPPSSRKVLTTSFAPTVLSGAVYATIYHF